MEIPYFYIFRFLMVVTFFNPSARALCIDQANRYSSLYKPVQKRGVVTGSKPLLALIVIIVVLSVGYALWVAYKGVTACLKWWTPSQPRCTPPPNPLPTYNWAPVNDPFADDNRNDTDDEHPGNAIRGLTDADVGTNIPPHPRDLATEDWVEMNDLPSQTTSQNTNEG